MDLKRGMGQIVSGGTTQSGENVKTQAHQVNVNCHYTATNMFNTPQYRAYMDPHFRFLVDQFMLQNRKFKERPGRRQG